MESVATDFALSAPTPSVLASPNADTTSVAGYAWMRQWAELTDDERKMFKAGVCGNVQDYLDNLEQACQSYESHGRRGKVWEWLEPFSKLAELLPPAASLEVQASPNPGSLVLGGIVAVLRFTSRLIEYQKLTLKMLARMGRKAKIVLGYEKDIYEFDAKVQESLILICGDIMKFCAKTFSMVAKKKKGGQLTARVKGKMTVLVKDYNSHFDDLVQSFEDHLEDLESHACNYYRRRIQQVYEYEVAHEEEIKKTAADAHQRFKHGEDYDILIQRQTAAVEQIEQRQRRKYRERLLSWLCSSEMNAAYDQACEEVFEGTGSWLHHSVEYEQWKNGGGSDLLWVRGKPGCGKTILAAVTVNELKLETDLGPETGLSFAFLRDEDESSGDPSTILGALAKQLLGSLTSFDHKLETEFVAPHRAKKPSRWLVKTALNFALSQFKKTFIVIDGLDECKGTDPRALVEITRDILDLLQPKEGSSVKIIVFSRPDYHIGEAFHSYQQIQPDYHNEEDLKAYIKFLFPRDERIQNECMRKANGMFLWVWLVWKSLQQPLKSSQKLKRLAKIPDGLDNLYNRMLEQVWEQESDLRADAFLVLFWTTQAKRPLSKEEMLAAVADYRMASTVEEASKHDSANDLIGLCKNLVIVDKDNYFRLCHESVRHHLNHRLSNPTLAVAEYQAQEENAQERLATICLTYLLLDDFRRGPTASSKEFASVVQRYPFLLYAARFWGEHVPDEPSKPLRDLIFTFVHSPEKRELATQVRLYDLADDSEHWKHVGSSNPLHILCLFGIQSIAKEIADVPTLARQEDASGITPFSYAMVGVHHGICAWLLQHCSNVGDLLPDEKRKISAIRQATAYGWTDVLNMLLSEDEALVNMSDPSDGRTPLTTACYMGKMESVSTLLNHGANQDLKDGEGRTPLTVAITAGHTNIALRLLEYGADPESPDENHITPLHYAAETNDDVVAQALLKKNASPIAQVTGLGNILPLHTAAKSGSTEVIRILHHADSQLDRIQDNGCTALHFAAWANAAEAATVLLELGIAKDAVDDLGRTALFMAAENGHLNTVQVLRYGSCDVGVEDGQGRTSVNAAVRSGDFNVIRAILDGITMDERKLLLNKKSLVGQTAFHEAINECDAKVLQYLLTQGADPTLDGIFDSSPLHYAAHSGNVSAMRLLLEKIKDPNRQNRHKQTPLHFAAQNGRFDFLVQFLQHCADLDLRLDIDAQDRDGNTALMLALEMTHEKIANLLVDKSSPRRPNADGNDHIHIAAWRGFESVVRKLVDHGGPEEEGYLSRTPLWYAAVRGNLSIVKLLMPVSEAVLNKSDHFCRTPVMTALECGNLNVVNYLLDNGAEHDGLDEDWNTLLHKAALIGDLALVQRLLNLGFQANTKNRYSDSPFSIAVACDHLEVVEEFAAKGFNEAASRAHISKTTTIIAAERGNLEMLQMLVKLGAPFGMRDAIGRSAASVAASGGHIEVLEYLKAHGESLTVVDRGGSTPLLIAASEGYPETVRYLLQYDPSIINDSNMWGESALIQAARKSHLLSATLLLANGADPSKPDATGLSAFDFVASDRSDYDRRLFQEILKTGKKQEAQTWDIQKEILSNTIRTMCTDILSLPSELDDMAHRFDRLCYLSLLADALRRVRDYRATEICTMELIWPEQFAHLQLNFSCNFCGSKKSYEGWYMCKSCFEPFHLCKACHDDYIVAGLRAPEAIEDLMSLESMVKPLRAAISDCKSLLDVATAVHYFEAGSRWVSSVREAYDTWEQMRNSSGKYQNLLRPGQEVVNLANDMYKIVRRAVQEEHLDLEDERMVRKLSNRYQQLRRDHRAEKESPVLVCRGHEFIPILEKNREKEKTNKCLDPESGRVTPLFLEELVRKYQESPLAQISSNEKQEDESPYLETPTSHRNNDASSVVNSSGPVSAARGQVSLRLAQPQEPLEADASSIRPTRSYTTPSLSNFPSSYDEVLPFLASSRAYNLPTLKLESSLPDKGTNAKKKETQVFPKVQAWLESGLSNERTDLEFSIATRFAIPTKELAEHMTTEPPANTGSKPALTPMAKDSSLFPDGTVDPSLEPMLPLKMTEEPESSITAQTPADIVSRKADEENEADNEYRILLLALLITDALHPGFADSFVQSLKDASPDKDSEASDGTSERTDDSSSGDDLHSYYSFTTISGRTTAQYAGTDSSEKRIWDASSDEEEIENELSNPYEHRGTCELLETEVRKALEDSNQSETPWCEAIVFSEIGQYIKQERGNNPRLSSVFTITGDSRSCFATTCRQYVDLYWGQAGCRVLDIVSSQLVPRASYEVLGPGFTMAALGTLESERVRSDTMVHERTEEPGPLDVISTWTCTLRSDQKEEAIKMLQALVWLTASFRLPEPGVLTSSGVSITRLDQKIYIRLEALEPLQPHEPSSCWQSLFKGFVVARGFPVRFPEQNGLDLPFDIMLHATRMLYCSKTQEHTTLALPDAEVELEDLDDYADTDSESDSGIEVQDSRQQYGLFFGGVDSLLYPISCSPIAAFGPQSSSKEYRIISWHYEDQAKSLVPPERSESTREQVGSIDEVRKSICILGYTPSAEIHLGTPDRLAWYSQMDETSAIPESPKAQVRLSNVAFGLPSMFGQGILQATAEIEYPQNTSLGEHTTKIKYNDVLEHAKKTPVILFDTMQNMERAWLVSTLSVILDLVHFRITDKSLNRCGHAMLQADGGAAAEAVLRSLVNSDLELRNANHYDSDKECVKDLVIKLWTEIAIRRTFDYMRPAKRKGSISIGNSMLLGWDLLELTRPLASPDARRRQFTVHEFQDNDLLVKIKPSWFELARDNSITVLFGHNIGSVIMPACACCKELSPPPRSKQYLIASFPALKHILTREECCYHLKCGLLWEHTDENVHPCTRFSHRVRPYKMQELRKKHTTALHRVTRRLPICPEGAIIFGERTTGIARLDAKLQGILHY